MSLALAAVRATDHAARVDRLRAAICQCENKVGRHACDVHAEEAARAVERLHARLDPAPRRIPDWASIVEAIAAELRD